MSNKSTKDKIYRGYKINNGTKKDFTCYTKTLDQVIDMTEYMVTQHSKSLFIRLDIRNEVSGEKILTRKDITRVVENIQRSVNSRYRDSTNKPDMNTVWTTENEDTTPHFHLYIGVNGNSIQNGYAILKEATKAVQKRLQTDNEGLVEFSKSNGTKGILVNRLSDSFMQEMNKAIYAGSYLAKTATKENRARGARVSSASRLPQGWKDNTRYKEVFDTSSNQNEEFLVMNEDDLVSYEPDDNFTCMHPPVDDFIEIEDLE